MALGESKLQLIDLLGLAQLANQRGYGRQVPDNTASNSNYDRAMRQEALKQERMKSLLAQNEYEQQTGVPTITMPGTELSKWQGPAHQVPISDIPGMVSGQRQSDYGKQVHEGLMQSGRLMAGMAEAAADANAKGQMYGGGRGSANVKESVPNNQKGYGVYPVQNSNILNLLATAKGESVGNKTNPLIDDQMRAITTLENNINDVELQRARGYSGIYGSPEIPKKKHQEYTDRITKSYQPVVSNLYNQLWKEQQKLQQMNAPKPSTQGDITVNPNQEVVGKINGVDIPVEQIVSTQLTPEQQADFNASVKVLTDAGKQVDMVKALEMYKQAKGIK